MTRLSKSHAQTTTGEAVSTPRHVAHGRLTFAAALSVVVTALVVFGSVAPAGAETSADATTVTDVESVAGTAAAKKTTYLYKIVYDATIYELVTNPDGTQTPVRLSYEKWRDVYGLQDPEPAATDFVKYPWSETVYAVTFWPGGEGNWLWTPLTYPMWEAAKFPTPRIAGWIKDSYFYKWATSDELFVEGPDGVNHKLSYKEWANSGFRAFFIRADEGFIKLSWAPELARISSLGTGAGRPLGYAEWQGEGFPTPLVVQRMDNELFYMACDSTDIWYAGPGMNRRISFQEWRAAGAPTATACLH
ncbi:hypothetical protein [Cryobacterium sp. AP23]